LLARSLQYGSGTPNFPIFLPHVCFLSPTPTRYTYRSPCLLALFNMAVAHPIFPSFFLMFVSFLLLLLVTLSTPIIKDIYFLDSNITGGVRYGVFGWCKAVTGYCWKKKLGYGFDPQIIYWLTKTLVFYPITTIFTMISMATLIPGLCSRETVLFPAPLYSLFSLITALLSWIAFIFMIGLFGEARTRLHRDGFSATLGPSVWMSLTASILITICAFHAGCGRHFRGNKSPYLARNRNRV